MKQRANRKRLSAYAGGDTALSVYHSPISGKRALWRVAGWRTMRVFDREWDKFSKQRGLR